MLLSETCLEKQTSQLKTVYLLKFSVPNEAGKEKQGREREDRANLETSVNLPSCVFRGSRTQSWKESRAADRPAALCSFPLSYRQALSSQASDCARTLPYIHRQEFNPYTESSCMENFVIQLKSQMRNWVQTPGVLAVASRADVPGVLN